MRKPRTSVHVGSPQATETESRVGDDKKGRDCDK